MSYSYNARNQVEGTHGSSTLPISNPPVPAVAQLTDHNSSTSFEVEHESQVPKQDKQSALDLQDESPQSDRRTVSHRLMQKGFWASDKWKRPSNANEGLPCPPPSRPWKETLLRAGPLSGILALLLSIASIVVSLGILIGSNHAPTQSWGTEPSTYPAICTAIANLAIRYACIRGVIITWWCRALRGTTFEKLHHDWRSGTTLQGAITSGSRIGLLGIACIASTLVYIDGPLLQRASTTVLVPKDQTISLNISMAPEIPAGFTGFWWRTPPQLGSASPLDGGFNATIPTSSGPADNYVIPAERHNDITNEINKPWLSGAPYSGVVRGCPETCRATLRAPALSLTKCKSHTAKLNWTAPSSADIVKSIGQMAPPLDHEAYIVALGLDVEEEAHESMNLLIGYSDIDDCVGTLYWSACTLRSAIGEYDVLIEDNAMTLKSANPKIIAVANNTRVIHTDPKAHSSGEAVFRSTLASIAELGTFNSVPAI